MALKIDLKPYERLIISGTVIRNGPKRSAFIIENSAPVLREKDIMRPDDATTYCSKIYLAIQMMYIDGTTWRNTIAPTGPWSKTWSTPYRAPSGMSAGSASTC
ncbi:MAG TPA: flagellar biosynthesis repressor FlbT [Syntrophales bacterium]|nr:flagellar biosynthesis repressor FlbT [Syntrophales bacterium]